MGPVSPGGKLAMRWHQTVVSLGVGLLCCCVAAAAEPQDSSSFDAQILKGADLPVDGPALLDYFRKKTLGPVDRAKIKDLVQRLGDNSYQVREKASADLVALGHAAESFLREAVRDPDIEVVRRAETCLKLIQRGR